MTAFEPARKRTLPGAIVLRRLSGLADLSEAAAAAILGLNLVEPARAGDHLPSTDGRAQRFLISGWACRIRLLSDGRRQILGFMLPGDYVDRLGSNRPLHHGALHALTAVQLLDARGLAGASIDRAYAGLAAQEEEFLLNHIVRLGRYTAHERMAHFLLELHDRLAAVGLAEGRRFVVPLTQEVLADTLGLSIVHVNRVLQHLRREHLIEIGRGHEVQLDVERLRTLFGLMQG